VFNVDQVFVRKLPYCDFCKREGKDQPAKYDSPTIFGPWAYLCEHHFKRVGRKFGATQLIKIKKREPKRRFDEMPVVTVPLTLDSVATVRCPYCGQPRNVEPDANYTVECFSCGEKYQVASLI